MKLIRFGKPGQERPGVILPDGRNIDVSSFIEDYNSDFFTHQGPKELKEWIAEHASTAPEISEEVRIGAPISDVGKIVCIGLNYSDHANEGGMDVPAEPILFFKATSSIVGPYDDVIIPKGSTKTDWEVELAIVIGKKASYVREEEAISYILGYCIHNDYSEREFQLERGGQWVKGKSCDTFAPLGPFVATKDEIEDPADLRLWLKVNGEMKQDGTTDNLIFGIAFLVSYISRYMTLLPGDVISTGTPAGVGLGFNPPQYLRPGDEVELGIDGLGISRQRIKAFNSTRD